MNYQRKIIELALLEDAAYDDITACATIAAQQQGQAKIIAKADGVLSGCTLADAVFATVNKNIQRHWLYHDGDTVQAGDCIVELGGSLRSLLAAERIALNFMQHLSGIATATHQYVLAVAGTSCHITDTRKTTPGLRLLEKKAVKHGGGVNHRMDLSAAFLIKENHIAAAGSITDAIAACYHLDDSKWVEVECENIEQVEEAVLTSPDIILLDNMSPAMVQQARALVPKSIMLEASGNITLSNVREYAQTGVNRVAIGAITHSTQALDLSMRVSAGKATDDLR